MKKTYLMPETSVQEIELQTVIAVSGPEQVHSDPNDGITDENEVLSRRRRSVWGDEDELLEENY